MGSVYDAELSSLSFDQALARVAAMQHGVISREQLRAVGGTKNTIRRRLDAGRLEAACPPYVFRVAGAPASWPQHLWIAHLAWGENTAISHRASAAAWSLPGFVRPTAELIVPPDRRRVAPGIVHRGRLHPTDITYRNRLPVTTVARTLIDLAAIIEPPKLEVAYDDAVRRKLVNAALIERRLAEIGRKGRPGVRTLMEIIQSRRPDRRGPESPAETRFLPLLKEAGLPTPQCQYEVRDEDGRIVARIDFAYPDKKIAFEIDGYAYHSSKSAWVHDRKRRNRLTAMGWLIIHVTWSDLDHPAELMATIRKAFGN